MASSLLPRDSSPSLCQGEPDQAERAGQAKDGTGLPVRPADARPGRLLLLESVNVDEASRRYMTKYDCTSVDINHIRGLYKTFLKKFLGLARNRFSLPILDSILSTPFTAELEPQVEGKLAQTD